MGKMIVTEGNYSKKSYLLKNSKLSIHSIEELCYCIIKNPELCEDFLYDRDLATFMDEELGLRERANLLADCIERDAPLKDLATVVFCSCDYLVREEIEDFVEELSRAERSEKWIRIKNKADSYLSLENYKNAVINYRSLVKDAGNLGITSENLGDIYHNMGIAFLHTEGFETAAECFRMAYEMNNREESLESYLLALKFAERNEEFKTALEVYDIPEKTVERLRSAVLHTELEASDEAELYELGEAEKLLKSGRTEEFYDTVARMTAEMKEQYIKYNE
ncbi:MAG: hypothetical protein K6G60_01850 [Lachnospiraceae bacterium]|nr:hypothetical protein [Lachnospiraceae bacterium]